MIDDYLLQVHKPARYIGAEWNLPKKDFASSRLKFALCFPDLYEIGMSNLGIRILYGILNSLPEAVCERFFSPELDLEGLLRQRNVELVSLESKRRLCEFDLIGFSLGYELSYTNVLNILDLGNIPLKANQRSKDYPLVIGGGPCALNPEPLAQFFDLFVIGEAEEVILELTALYAKLKDDFKSGSLTKERLLAELAKIEGVYAPSLYDTALPQIIKKRFIRDLENAYFPLEWLVPYIQIVHDRLTLEVMRGCPNRCRFCQARSCYYPLRQRSPENIFSKATELYRRSGYEEISLTGLSVSDYPYLEELLKKMIGCFAREKVSVSLPSIKPKAMLGDLSELIASIKKTSLTFAPEASSERLRRILAKDFDEDDFFKVIQQAYAAGYQHIKLYFMIGLPFEEDADLDSIITFATLASEARRKIGKAPAQINISINPLIPKPHTPLQWFAMEPVGKLKAKSDYLRSKAKNKRLKFSIHNLEMSFLEAVLSRGDRRLSQVIEAAFSKGARFDAWDNHFNFALWQEAFLENAIEPDFYLKEKHPDQVLPWDFIDTGIDRQALLSEFKKVIES